MVAIQSSLPLLADKPIPSTDSTNANPTITLGLLNMGGPWDKELRLGVTKAIAEINQQREAGQPAIHLRHLDAPRRWAESASPIARMIFNDHAVALIGPTQEAHAHVAAQVATKGRVPIITLSGEDELTQVADPWIFRGIPSDSKQAETMLRWALRESKFKDAVAIVPRERTARLRGQALQKVGSNLGVGITLQHLGDTVGASDQPILLWLDPEEVCQFLDQMQKSDSNPPRLLLGSLRSVHPTVIDATSRSTLKVHVPLTHAKPFPGTTSNSVYSYGTIAYRTVHQIHRVILKEGRKPGDIKRGLLTQSASPRLRGSSQFDASGNRVGALHIGTIQNGKLK